jgi:hypothetical protein
MKSSIFVYLLNDYLLRNYPFEYNNFITKISYNAIFCYSKLQIVYNKYKSNKFLITFHSGVRKLLDTIYSNNGKNNSEIEIITFKNGVIHIEKYTDDSNKDFNSDNNFYIFSDSKNENTRNYIITHSPVFPHNYEISNIKFVMMELILGNKNFKIDLKTNEYNFYVVSNILNKDFFLFYIFNNLHKFEEKLIYDELSVLIESGKVTILDNNVNKHEIDFTRNESLTILKDSFTINHTS